MTTKNSKIFVDTNVVIRANIKTAPLHTEALEILEQFNQAASELWISRQVLREYIRNTTRPQTYSPALTIEVVSTQVQTFEHIFKVADETIHVTATLLKLLKEFPTGGSQVHDANIVATMLTYGIDTLVTHNIEDMKRFSSTITIIPLISSTT